MSGVVSGHESGSEASVGVDAGGMMACGDGGVGSGRPTVYLIAGPNGSGKTTFALKFLPEMAGCLAFVNADEIARGLSPLNPPAAAMQATRLFLAEIEQKIRQREDFAFETTLSGRVYLPKIREWRSQGWRVVMVYLYLPSAEMSLHRVQERVAQGGHGIPEAEIARRYPRSLRHLFEYMRQCDRTFCLDNSRIGIRVIFESCLGGEPEVKDQELYQRLLKETLDE